MILSEATISPEGRPAASKSQKNPLENLKKIQKIVD